MLLPAFFYHQLFTTLPTPTGHLAGQTIIITGANRGLGYEATKHLVRLGVSKLILGVRSVPAGEEAKASLLKEYPTRSPEIVVWPLDLTSYASVKEFAKRVQAEERVDVLCNNAGFATSVFKLAEGEESQLTVNVISTFLLTILLLPKLRESAEKFGITPRVTVVGSEAMNWVDLKERAAKEGGIIDAMNDKDKVKNMGDRYFLSKLMVMFCVRELAAAMDKSPNNGPKGRQVILNCAAPGYVATELAHEQMGSAVYRAFERAIARKPEEGSRCLVDGVMKGQESHGQYLSECKVKPVGKFTRSEEGKKTQKRVWNEVLARLEKIQPGITANI